GSSRARRDARAGPTRRRDLAAALLRAPRRVARARPPVGDRGPRGLIVQHLTADGETGGPFLVARRAILADSDSEPTEQQVNHLNHPMKISHQPRGLPDAN